MFLARAISNYGDKGSIISLTSLRNISQGRKSMKIALNQSFGLDLHSNSIFKPQCFLIQLYWRHIIILIACWWMRIDLIGNWNWNSIFVFQVINARMWLIRNISIELRVSKETAILLLIFSLKGQGLMKVSLYSLLVLFVRLWLLTIVVSFIDWSTVHIASV
jgi:hypothetical protein